MAFISYGFIDKKLIILAFMIALGLLDNYFENKLFEEYFDDIISSLLREVGPIIAGVILIYTLKQKQNKFQKDKKSFKYIIILFLLRIVRAGYERIFPYVVKDRNYRFGRILNTTNGLIMNLITLGTFLSLKYKYYIHHMISMIIFLVLSITNDFILENYSNFKFNYIYVYFLYLMEEVAVFCYLKYMMDKLYYQYMEVLLYWGITGFIVKLLVFSIFIIYENKKEIEGIINELYVFFTETNVLGIIFIEFLYWLIYTGIYYLLLILVLYYLRPNHMIISDEIGVFTSIIFYQERPNKIYTLITFIFQIFALMLYFEIIELNFCKLNYNTAKNIKLREGNDGKQRQLSEIELGGEYILINSERKPSDVEIEDYSNPNSLNNQDYDLFEKEL